MARKPKPTCLNLRTTISCWINRSRGSEFTVKSLRDGLSIFGFSVKELTVELIRREKIKLIVDTGKRQKHGVGRPVKVYKQKWVIDRDDA